MDRPAARNAIGKDMLRGLRHTLETINADSSANVVMICSSVPKVFCAGADLKVKIIDHFDVHLFYLDDEYSRCEIVTY